MPARAKAQAMALREGASDSEDDLMTAATNRATASKGAENKRDASKVTKAKSMAAQVGAGKTATKRKIVAPKQSRQALKDRTNLQPASDTEAAEGLEDDDMAGAKPKAKRAKTTAARKNTTSRAASEPVEERTTAKGTAGARKGKAAKPSIFVEPPLDTIPETQPDPEYMEDVTQSIEFDPTNMDIAQEPTPPKLQRCNQRAASGSVQPLAPRLTARSISVQPTYPPARDRSGSASATERRGGDPDMRRKLNEITKKYDNLQLKYEGLEEIGKTSTETNFEKLKRASDQKAKDANDLVAALKKELAELKKVSSSSSSETVGMQKQITTLTSANDKLAAERDGLKDKLQISQNETKSLEAKLVAARQQLSSSAQEAKAHEATAKNNTRNAANNTSDAQKEAKMKENLYSDLTGLIIRAVKRKDGEDEYDCIQTGRNGTLHFHLSVGNDSTTPHPKTPSGLSYEDAEFAYEPLLDEDRDRDLLDLLPDYLTEEICFPRNHAQRFYTKLVDSMTKKIVVEED